MSQFVTLFLKALFKAKGPLVILDADDWEQSWTPGLATNPPLAKFLAWQEEWGLRHCDAITVASQWLWRRARYVSPVVPCLYLPNGIENGGQVRNISTTSGNSILWVTRFVEVSPDWISRFWLHFRVLRPQSRLIVAGSPIEFGLDRPFQAAFGPETLAGKEVEFLGMVNYQELQELYASCTCVMAPAREEAASLAKCSVKLLDSFRYGFKCVASMVGEQTRFRGWPSMVLLRPEATPEEFATAVAMQAQPHADRSLSKGNGFREKVPDWRYLAEKLEQFYGDLQSKHL